MNTIATPTGEQGLGSGRSTFPRSSRLLKPTDFKRVFQKNVVSADRFFRIIARPSRSGEARLGMAVSRKVDRRAVGRNRIKRVVRESFRQRRGHAPSPVLDFVVLARPASASICNEQLFHSLERHWQALERLADKKFSGESSA